MQGHMEGQYNIGFFFREGDHVKQDFRTAVKWFKLSAAQGDTEAQRDLGYCYFYGQGLRENYKKAGIQLKKLTRIDE